VLVVDRARPTGEPLLATLEQYSYEVTMLDDPTPDAVRLAIEALRADVVLLDGPSAFGGATAWGEPSWLRSQGRTVPVVMFAGSTDDLPSALAGARATRHGPLNEARGVPVPL
jgi:DNA-binding response OmpR family regulator